MLQILQEPYQGSLKSNFIYKFIIFIVKDWLRRFVLYYLSNPSELNQSHSFVFDNLAIQ